MKEYSRQDKIQFIKENYVILSYAEISTELGITEKQLKHLVNNSRVSGIDIPFKVKKLTEDENGNRQCNSCEIFQPTTEFTKKCRTVCKSCIKIQNKIYKDNNKDKTKIKGKIWLENNREHFLKIKKDYRESHKEEISNYAKEWEKKNKTNRRNYARERENKKKKTDPLFKLTHTIRNLLLVGFKANGYKKKIKGEKILGCSYIEFQKHIESLFEPWMSWENQGNKAGFPNKPKMGWDIDHIIPLCTAKTEEDIIRLNHYTNLQPLCAFENRFIKRQNHNYGTTK